VLLAEKKPLRERTHSLKACKIKGQVPESIKNTQTRTFPKKGMSQKSRNVFLPEKKPLRERTHSLKACMYLLKRQEFGFDFAEGES